MAKKYPRVKNQIDHRADFFRRLAAGKVQTTSKPTDRPAAQRAKPRLRTPPTNAEGKPMSLAEQLGLLGKLRKAKTTKPRKIIQAPVVLTPDKPRKPRKPRKPATKPARTAAVKSVPPASLPAVPVEPPAMPALPAVPQTTESATQPAAAQEATPAAQPGGESVPAKYDVQDLFQDIRGETT